MKTKITLQDIPLKEPLEGYLWWSNSDKPEVYNNELIERTDILGLDSTNNPFIIEGNLWNKANQSSYLIRFIDGEYLAFKFDIKQIPVDQITDLLYLPNRMPGIEKLKFKEIWMPVSDPYCEKFEVLKPSFIAFVGF